MKAADEIPPSDITTGRSGGPAKHADLDDVDGEHLEITRVFQSLQHDPTESLGTV